MKPLSKSKYMLGLQCPKLLWRTVHEPDAPELIPGPELKARFAHGHQVGALARDRFSGGVLIPPKVTEVKAMMRATTTAIDSGANAVFEATFANEDARCAVDVLERREDGRWSVLEVKATTKAKPQHVEDLAFQVWLAREVGGLEVASAEVMHLNRNCRAPHLDNLFERSDVTEEVLGVVSGVPTRVGSMRSVVDGLEPEVAPGPHCKKPYPCPFLGRCTAGRPKGHVSELYRIRTDRVTRLEQRGISTIAQLPDSEKLSPVQQRQLKAARSGERWVGPGLAKALDRVSGVVAHLDFETVSTPVPVWDGCRPWQQVPVQVSIHVERDGGVEHHEHLAEPGEDPRRGVAEFLVRTLSDVDTICVWYEAFERGRIAELEESFPDLAEELKDIDAKVVDLLPIVRDHVYDEKFGGSFSIKRVLPALCPGEGWGDLEVAGGGLAAVLLERYLLRPEEVEDVQALRRDLLAYCERDTWAMVVLLRGLRTLVR